jgi:hypothetical protein
MPASVNGRHRNGRNAATGEVVAAGVIYDENLTESAAGAVINLRKYTPKTLTESIADE